MRKVAGVIVASMTYVLIGIAVSAEPSTTIKIAEGIKFSMNKIINDNTTHYFPREYADKSLGSVAWSYSLGVNEVTYRLWSYIYNWAIERGYVFYTPGNQGGQWNSPAYEQSDLEPVAGMAWSDAIAWCNALTQYCAEITNSEPDYVYWCDKDYTKPFINAKDIEKNIKTAYPDSLFIKAKISGNKIVSNCTSKGFRLPNDMEWEYAARYIGQTESKNVFSGTIAKYNFSTMSDHFLVAKASSARNIANIEELAKYAVIKFHTEVVGSREPNYLGLYDMIGNVSEWCYSLGDSGSHDGYFPGLKGNAFFNVSSGLESYGVGMGWQYYNDAQGYLGFRIAKSD